MCVVMCNNMVVCVTREQYELRVYLELHADPHVTRVLMYYINFDISHDDEETHDDDQSDKN